MKAFAVQDRRRVVVVSGKHSVAISIGWPKKDTAGLLGFAIIRTNPDQSSEWLKNALVFEGTEHKKGSLSSSKDSPIQSFIWTDMGLSDDPNSYGLIAGASYQYEVIPVSGSPGGLVHQKDLSVKVKIQTEAEEAGPENAPEAFFNRGLSSYQEYERLFKEDPQGGNSWLSRDLKPKILKFIQEVHDTSELNLYVAAYHLDDPEIISAISALGKRARVSLDWGSDEKQDDGPNQTAYQKLVNSGVYTHKREHVSISHNKYMIQVGENKKALAVLTGSTNFTKGGVSSQSNQSVVIKNSNIASLYLDNFELVIKNDNAGLRDLNAKAKQKSDQIQVFFSPHSSADRPDLDRFTELAKSASHNRLFMTFRMTDKSLIEQVLSPSTPTFGVVDRVYKGTENSGDRLLFEEAHTANPRIAAANYPLSDEPDEGTLFKEVKREGYEPLIHHKILLFDWNTPDCVVVTGSANYSTNSTEHNDENSVVIIGDQRLAEEYFVEFCRLYQHWMPRWLHEREAHQHHPEMLSPDDSWTSIWADGGRANEFLQLSLSCLDNQNSSKYHTKKNLPSQKSSTGSRNNIEHVVILMLENRSFDQILGQLPGVEGILDRSGKLNQNFFNVTDPQNPDKSESYPVSVAKYYGIPEGDIPPPQIKNGVVSDLYGGPSHSFPAASLQRFNDTWGPGGNNSLNTTPGFNSGFIHSYYDELMRTYKSWNAKDPDFEIPKQPLKDHLDVVMASYRPDQLPVINTLAQEFCVCDHWFSEVPGPTEPNRLFVHCGTSEGLIHNPWSYPIRSRTIYEDLDEQGQKSWAFYKFDLSDSDNFPALKKQTHRIRDFSQFEEDLKNPETFPNYSFLCPRYIDSEEGFANSQHAPYDLRYGEHWIADVYEALRKSELWEKTLLVVTYDEHGGFYDHVVPPDKGILPPDKYTSPTNFDRENCPYMFETSGNPKKQYQFSFNRLGFRVPAVLISPWIPKGYCEKRTLQHTSILATIRNMWNLNPRPLTAREGQARSFNDLFETLSSPRNDCPLTIRRPKLPARSLSEALNQPLSPVQKEIFQQVLHLDGHPDSGIPVKIPKTQGEAAKYIQDRRKGHNKANQSN